MVRQMKLNRQTLVHFAVIAALFIIGVFSAALGMTLMHLLQVQQQFGTPPNYPAALALLGVGVVALTLMMRQATDPRCAP